MSEGIVTSVVDVESINKEKGAVVAALEEITKDVDLLKNSIIEINKAIKESSSISELSNNIKKFNEETVKLSLAIKEQQQQSEKLVVVNQKLKVAEEGNAKQIARTRIEMQARAKAAKEAAMADMAAEKALKDYGIILKEGANSVRKLRDENKALNKIVNELDVDTQSEEIDRLNKAIEDNSEVIRMNKDAYTQQKMNIGNYQSALDGVRERINLATKAISEMTAKGDTQSKEYIDLQKKLQTLNEEQDKYTKGLTEAIKAADPLKSELTAVKNEMTQLIRLGKANWTEEQKQQYSSLQVKAVELQKSINAVKNELDILAKNNLSLNSIIEGVSLVTASFQTWYGAMALMGGESEKFKEVITRLQGAMAVLNGLETLSAKLKAGSVIQIRLQKAAEEGNTAQKWAAVGATKALAAAQKAMPYAALVAGSFMAAKALYDYATNAGEATKQQKMLNSIDKEASETIAKEVVQLNLLSKAAKGNNQSVKEQQNIITSLNSIVEKTGKHFNTWEEAQRFLIENKDEYIKSMKEVALQQAYLNKYTELQIELDNLARESADPGFWDYAWSMFKSGGNAIAATTDAMLRNTDAMKKLQDQMAAIDNKMDPTAQAAAERVKQAGNLVAALDDWNRTEIQKLTKKYEEEKQLLVDNGKDTTKLTQKYNMEVANINRAASERIRDIRISIMKDGRAKEMATLDAAEQKELSSITKWTTKGAELRSAIIEKYRVEREKKNNELDIQDLQKEANNWQLKIDVAKQGSQEWLDATTEQLNIQRSIEEKEAEKTGASVKDINAKYDKLIIDAFSTAADTRIAKVREGVEEQGRILGEKAQAELDVELDRYKKGEINREQYDQKIADIQHKYNVQTLNDYIKATETILKTEGLTTEQRLDIEKQLYDAKKALSDAETSHEVENIDKVNDARKRATEQGIALGKQAFEMAMEFLSQQTQAKIDAIDAELSKVDEQRERELQRLDESVMSEETRAEETKRINEQAEQQRKKLESEKRKEQQKMAIIGKAQAAANVMMTTAQAVIAALAPPPVGLGPVFGPIIAGSAAALGAAQLAMVVAQPIPQYAHGTDDHIGGYAVVGDGGKHEYVQTPTGKVYETPAVSTIMDIPKHSIVYPDIDSMWKAMRPEIPKYEVNNTASDMSSGIDRIEKAVKQIKPVQNVSMNLDTNGIWHVSNSKSGSNRFTNSRIKFKS